MKNHLLLCLVIQISSLAMLTGQSKYVVDSLNQQLTILGQDTLRVDAWNELAYQYRRHPSDSAVFFARKALALAENLSYDKGKADGYMRMGLATKYQGKLSESKGWYLKAFHGRRDLQDFQGAASACNNLGNLQKAQNWLDSAQYYFKEGLALVEDQQLAKIKATLHNNLGNLERQLGNYEEAATNFDQSSKISEALGDKFRMAATQLNLGTMYQSLQNYEQANLCYQRSLVIYQEKDDPNDIVKCYINIGNNYYLQSEFDQALNYYEKALRSKGNIHASILAEIHNNIGSFYKVKKDFGLAKEHYQTSLKHFQSQSNDARIAFILYNLGTVNQGLELLKDAENAYLKSLRILDTLPDPSLKWGLLLNLSEIYAGLGKYTVAYQYRNRSNVLRDSLNENYRSAMNYKFNFEEAEKRNALLQREYAIKEAENQKKSKRLISVILIFALGLAIGLGFFYYYQQRQKTRIAEKNQQITSQQKQLVQNEIDELLATQEIRAAHARIEGQDTERKRIAQDLHDRLGSMLSTIKLYFDETDSKIEALKESNVQSTQKVAELIDEACTEVRRIAHNMQSGILTRFGLVAELKSLTRTLNDSKKIKVELNTFGFQERLNNSIEISIYRIIQELISNVLKHANATNLSIQINRFDDILNILIEDDGQGFNPESIDPDQGMGLKNVRTRVAGLNGTFSIDSGKGNGTTTSIDIPMPAPLTSSSQDQLNNNKL